MIKKTIRTLSGHFSTAEKQAKIIKTKKTSLNQIIDSIDKILDELNSPSKLDEYWDKVEKTHKNISEKDIDELRSFSKQILATLLECSQKELDLLEKTKNRLHQATEAPSTGWVH